MPANRQADTGVDQHADEESGMSSGTLRYRASASLPAAVIASLSANGQADLKPGNVVRAALDLYAMPIPARGDHHPWITRNDDST